MRLHAYLANVKTVLRTMNNPLKKKQNLFDKDNLESRFYDQIANDHLAHFDEKLFTYDEHESMPSSHRYFYAQLENIKNKAVLDICCGYGFTSVVLAKRGAQVTSIDISAQMVRLTEKNGSLNRVTDNISPAVMSAQKMAFRDEQFDFVVGLGALHHLNLETARAEIYRVLKRGGTALFIEPRIPYKWLIVLRSLLPAKSFESPGGSQLHDREVAYFLAPFSSHYIHYSLFLRKLSRFGWIKKHEDLLDKADIALVERWRFLRKLYWAMVIMAKK